MNATAIAIPVGNDGQGVAWAVRTCATPLTASSRAAPAAWRSSPAFDFPAATSSRHSVCT